MLNTSSTGPIPAGIRSPQALDAFHHIFDLVDWRLSLVSLEPISVGVEYDDDFREWLEHPGSWKTSETARTWFAKRIVDLAGDMDNTYIRSLSLQHPHSIRDADTGPFLDHLRWRIERIIRAELHAHYDTSISQWESDASDFVGGDDDRMLRERLLLFLGLDQVVSTDAARKAIKHVFNRMHWHLVGTGASLTLVPDHLFRVIQPRRAASDERTCARSLIARGIQVLVDDHVRRFRAGEDLAPLTRDAIRDTIQRKFDGDGVWGLIDLVIRSDRERYYIATPYPVTDHAAALIERQRVRMDVSSVH